MSLRVKLTLALLTTSLLGVIIFALLVQRFTASEFDNFVLEQERADFIANMATYYEVFGSWENMRMARGRLPVPPAPDSSAKPPPQDIMFATSMNQFALVDVDGHVIIPNQNVAPNRIISAEELGDAEPVVVDEQTVGYVVTGERVPRRDILEKAYLDRINWMLVIAAVSAVAVALILSLLFARSLSKPLREIAAAIQSISSGNLEQQVPVRSHDEVGQVAMAFNQMSTNLAQANHLRRQMTADIAHELRTPLSVVVGYLASLSEGLLKPSPDRFRIMHDEAQHLQRLVEDLRILSLADAGELPLNFQGIDSGELIHLAAAAFSHQAEQKHITLSVQLEPAIPLLYADPDRILQVLANLLSNALRHTPEQGAITLVSRLRDGRIELSIQDTGSGIAAAHLPHVFERFYRADAARHQEQNESGLGLAIAKSIVEAHKGQITATSRVGEGTTILMTFPPLSAPS